MEIEYDLEERLYKMAVDANYAASSLCELAEEHKNNGGIELALQTMVIVDRGHQNADDLQAAALAVRQAGSRESKSKIISATEAFRQLADKMRVVNGETLRVKAHRLESGDPDWANPDTDPIHRVDRGGRDDRMKALGAAEWLESFLRRLQDEDIAAEAVWISELKAEAIELRRKAKS